MAQVQVSTREYEFSHGKSPRGTGNWAFFFGDRDDAANAQWFTGSYGDAKKQAVAYAKAHGHRDVQVGS